MANEYAKLTAKQRNLIEVLAVPGNDELSVVKICELAGISPPSYYKFFSNPDFLKAYDRLTRDLIKAAVIPIVKASTREGLKGSHQDRKMLLEMAGTYQSKQSLDIDVKGFEDLLLGLAAPSNNEG